MTAASNAAMERGRQAALEGRWDDAIAAFAAAEAEGDAGARVLALRARLNQVRELAPDPLEPAPASVERYVQALQRLEAALLTAADDEVWAVAALAETRRRIFDELRFARRRFTGSVQATVRLLNHLFLLGASPAPPLDGRYRGDVIALAPGFGLDVPMQLAAGLWMPWKGKVFDAAAASGENVFDHAAWRLVRLVWPGYIGLHPDPESPGAFRAFPFRTWAGPGVRDPERQTLKLDYDSPGNPASVRRILDEVVQLSGGVYLGKAHIRGFGGRWRTVAYFALRPPAVREEGPGTAYPQ